MSYNGSGTFQINTTGQPVVTGTVISSTAFNALTADLATGLSTAITKDGQTATTARIPFAAGISSTLVTDSTSTSTGSIITAGGVGIAKALYVGTTANFGGVATYSAQPIFSSLTASTAVATDASKGLVSVTNTGTGNNVLGTGPTISLPVIDNIKMGYSTTATAAGTTTLTVASNYRQFFTGSTTQTIVLPVTSTLVTGIAFEIENNSTGLLTVNSSGGNLVGTIPAGVCAHAVCIGTTLTTAADWDWDYISTSTITGTGANVLGTSPTLASPIITGSTPQVTTYTSSSGTYTVPTNARYLQVRMVGGGGGGGGGSSAGNATAGNAGGNTTFGTSLLTANGGSGGGVAGGGSGGAGGTATIGAGASGIALSGGIGTGNQSNAGATQFTANSSGGQSALGGGAGGGPSNTTGTAGATNTGGGGSGGMTTSAVGSVCGAAGGAGGYIDAYITTLASTYSYAVGGSGTAGAGGTNGYAGGAGGSGVIYITAFF